MKVGVIGCGYWGPNLVRNLLATGRCSAVRCFDSSSRAIQKILSQFPTVTPAESVDDLLRQSDAIVIATPVKSHGVLAQEALRAGKPVFVEKPLAGSYAEGADLVDLAARMSLPLMTGYTFLYSPAVCKIRQYVRDGVLGNIYSFSSSRENLGIHRQDVDVLWDLAPHDLSMLLFWLGESPTRASAHGRACLGRNLDVASLQLEFASGTIANIEVSWLAPNKLRRTVIKGSQRMVVYDDTQSNEKIRLYDCGATLIEAPASFGEYQLTYRNGDLLSPWLDSKEPLLAQTHAFLNWVEHGTEPKRNVWISLQVIATLEAASRSLRENGRLVAVAGAKTAAPLMTPETTAPFA